MKFIVFNLDDFHRQQKEGTKVGFRFIEAKSLQAAKDFMRTYYPGAWAVVPKKTFDQGIVNTLAVNN